MTWDRYMRSIVPIGALFSASLVFSNLAYIDLSVSFIQMYVLCAAMSCTEMWSALTRSGHTQVEGIHFRRRTRHVRSCWT